MAEAGRELGLNRATSIAAMPTTTTLEKSTKERFTLPWALSEWADEEALFHAVDETLGGLDWSNAELTALLAVNPTFQPRFLLTLLTYAYALGICESEEVVAFYYSNPNLRRIFPGRAPSASELSRFRRENRGLLKWSLSELFKQVLRQKFALGDALMPAGLRRYLQDVATARLDVARDMDRTAHGAL